MLNEALANPHTAYDAEWVELYNSSTEPAELGGWKIDDSEGAGAPYSLPEGTSILPGEYLVITLPSALLNNSGDSLRLLRPDGTAADMASLPSTRADTSYNRASDGSWYVSDTPSPGAANLSPAPEQSTQSLPPARDAAQTAQAGGTPAATASAIPHTGAVLLSEALPNPHARYASEWVELANHSDTPADLGGWMIDDGSGGGSPFKLPAGTQLAAQGLLLVELPKALLNNGGDTVRLLRPDGSTADEHRFEAAQPDTSTCRVDQAWLAQCAPSPGQPNRAPASAHPANTAVPADAGMSDSALPSQAGAAGGAPLPTPRSAASAPQRAPARIPARFMNQAAAQPYAPAAKGQRYTGQAAPTGTAPVPAPRTQPTPNPQPAPAAPSLPTVPIGLALLALGAGSFAWGRRKTLEEQSPPPGDI